MAVEAFRNISHTLYTAECPVGLCAVIRKAKLNLIPKAVPFKVHIKVAHHFLIFLVNNPAVSIAVGVSRFIIRSNIGNAGISPYFGKIF